MHLPNPKLLDLDEMVRRRDVLRSDGRKLVMTNGCFDLLHTGHIYFLQHARALGDSLVVALNADRSVQALKGPLRPVQSEEQRAFALGALACVDHVVVFTQPDLVAEIAAIQPDVYTKAGDYTLERLHAGERRELEAAGADIRFLPFLDGFSTTALIARITRAGGLG
jgi:rfaE bifunctional protein nucleotidyltransferase chain/domain